MTLSQEEWEKRQIEALEKVESAVLERARAWSHNENLFLEDFVVIAAFKDMEDGQGGIHVAHSNTAPYRIHGLVNQSFTLLGSYGDTDPGFEG